MKAVINRCFGGFSLPTEFCEKYGIDKYDDEFYDISRTDERLVSFVESKNFTQPTFSKLSVVEIPDNATDWEISEYDGAEEIICVVDGTIWHI